MITVTKLADGNIGVKFNFYQDYVDRIKKISFAKFDQKSKMWIIPNFSFLELENSFYGELAYITPRWILANEPMPDYRNLYKIDRDIKIPSLKITPFDYQEYGIKYMINKLYDNKLVMNCDSVGLGKTVEAIGTLKYVIDNFNFSKILIVCQKSLKTQWLYEIKKFSDIVDNIPGYIISGKKTKRQKLYKEIKGLNSFVMITNYHTVMNDKDVIKNLGFDVVVADEIHTIKARTGVINKAMQEVCKDIKKAIFLTGTPIMDKPDDLFGIVQIIDKDYFGSWKDFEKKYIVKENRYNYQIVIGYKYLNELREKCQNLIIRRTENEVDISLPEVMPNKEIRVSMDETQNKILESINKQRNDIIEKIKDIEDIPVKNRSQEDNENLIKYKAIEKGFIACSQAVANDPRLFLRTNSKFMKHLFKDKVPKNYVRSEKIEALLDLIREILPNNEKIIIFSKFKKCCEIIAEDIKKEFNEPVLLYTGSENDEQREKAKELFCNDDNYKIICCTTAAENGLNLQVARHQINFEVPDNPASETQRMGRIRRAGSKYKRVFTYTFITEGSIDINKLEKLNEAKKLIGGLIELDEAQSVAIKEMMKEYS